MPFMIPPTSADGARLASSRVRPAQRGDADHHPPPQPAGELAGKDVSVLSQVQLLYKLICPSAGLPAGEASQRPEDAEVIVDGEVLEQRRLLGHDTEVVFGAGRLGHNVVSKHPDLA